MLSLEACRQPKKTAISPELGSLILSWTKDRNGAIPVPGPTRIKGVLLLEGREKELCRMATDIQEERGRDWRYWEVKPVRKRFMGVR